MKQLNKLKWREISKKINSDDGAVGSVEVILYLALAIFAAVSIYRGVMIPMKSTSKGIGSQIEKMNPER